MARNPDALQLPKAEPRWFDGVWLGRTEASGEHVVATQDVIRFARTFRLLPPGSQRADVFQRMAV